MFVQLSRYIIDRIPICISPPTLLTSIMATLVETVILLLLLYIVYIYKPQDNTPAPASAPAPRPAPDVSQVPPPPAVLPLDEGDSASTATRQSPRPRLRPRSESVFRASMPLRRSESQDLDFEVPLIADREADVKPTIDRVFEVCAMVVDEEV